jgi:excisionase family DNA binding protein
MRTITSTTGKQRLLLAETLAAINSNNQAIARLIDAFITDDEEDQPLPPAASVKNYLNIAEVADYTGFSITHIYRLAETGVLNSYRPSGHKLFFKRTDIDGEPPSQRL